MPVAVVLGFALARRLRHAAGSALGELVLTAAPLDAAAARSSGLVCLIGCGSRGSTSSDSCRTYAGRWCSVAGVCADQRSAAPAAAAGRVGVTAAPFLRWGPGVALDLARRARRLGYGSFWVAEVTGTEAFSVLGAVSQREPGMDLGTGVLPVQVRTPALLAMAAASLQALAPDRDVLLGIGVSSPVVAGVAAIRTAHLAGDRGAALDAVPDQMIDAIDVVGSSELVSATIAAYRQAGVQVPVVFPVTWGAAGADETAALDATLRAAAASREPVPGRNAS